MPGVRAIIIFISSSSTSDSARVAQAVLLEQRLLLERLEVEVLRERVDEILVAPSPTGSSGRRRPSRRAELASSASSFDALPADRRRDRSRPAAARSAARPRRGGSCGVWSSPRIRNRSSAAQHDVVAAVGEPLDVRDERRCSRSGRPAAGPRSRCSHPGRSSTMPIMRSPASASATISRYRGSKMCSGRNTFGKSTTFGSGKSGSRSDMVSAIGECRSMLAAWSRRLPITGSLSESSSSSCPCSPSARTGRACTAS